MVCTEDRLMPKFHVTGPDGHTYEINAPEGASE